MSCRVNASVWFLQKHVVYYAARESEYTYNRLLLAWVEVIEAVIIGDNYLVGLTITVIIIPFYLPVHRPSLYCIHSLRCGFNPSSEVTVFIRQNLTSSGDRPYTSESDVWRRQILTYKDGLRAEIIKIMVVMVIKLK